MDSEKSNVWGFRKERKKSEGWEEGMRKNVLGKEKLCTRERRKRKAEEP